MVDRALSIESQHQHGPGAANAELRHRLRRAAKNGAADRLDILHEDTGKIEPGQIIELRQRFGLAVGIVERDRRALEAAQQGGAFPRRKRMRHRLEEGIAAALVAESLDPKLHCNGAIRPQAAAHDLASERRECYPSRPRAAASRHRLARAGMLAHRAQRGHLRPRNSLRAGFAQMQPTTLTRLGSRLGTLSRLAGEGGPGASAPGG